MNKNPNNIKDDELLLFTKLFSEFDKTSLNLRKQYNALQQKVEDLLEELEEKNNYLDKVYQKQQQTNDLLYTILANLSSGVVVFNRKQQVIVFNKKAAAITKIDPDEALGLNYNDIFEFKDDDANLLLQQSGGEYNLEVEKEIIDKSGDTIPIYVKTSVVFDQNDEIDGYVHLFDDLTKIKDMEEDVRKNRSLSEIGQMASGIAHEIRNPLGGISGFATMLARDLKDEPEKLEIVKKIQQGVKSLNQITSDVLAFNRPVKVRLMQLPIREIINNTVELIEAELLNNENEKEFEIIKNYPASSLKVDIDMQLIQVVLLNLLRNAAQAVKDGKIEIKIKLRFNLFKNYYTINIKDNGCGISEEAKIKLFTPFFTTKAEGTGLGLAMVKKIVEAMKGKIELKSGTQGTNFEIILPIKNF